MYTMPMVTTTVVNTKSRLWRSTSNVIIFIMTKPEIDQFDPFSVLAIVL